MQGVELNSCLARAEKHVFIVVEGLVLGVAEGCFEEAVVRISILDRGQECF